MTKYNTPALRAQRNSLVKPEHLISDPAGNVHAPSRDQARLLSKGQRLFQYDVHGRSAVLFIGPGETFDRQARREIEGIFGWVKSPKDIIDRAEIEFSASPQQIFQSAEGLPEDYGNRLINWALAQSRSIVICVDDRQGVACGEPHRVLSPLQATFHCAPDHAEIWIDYLGRRVRRAHRFAVVRLAGREVQA